MNDPKNPEAGERSIDVTDLELHDITPDEAQRLLKLRDGYPEAIKNVMLADSAIRKKAGLSEVEVTELNAKWQKLQRIDQVLPAVRKLLELLEETRLVEGADVAMRLGEMANQARRRAGKLTDGNSVLAAFEPLLDYQYGLAQQAANRRSKSKGKPEEDAAAPAAVTPATTISPA